MRLANVNALRNRAWAMERNAFERIVSRALDLEADLFADADPTRVEQMYAAREGSSTRAGAVAIVPIVGPITQRDSFFTLYFGGTSVNRLVATLRALAADDSVGTILLDIDSPGGESSGLPELATAIRTLRESKRVVALAHPIALSAAYWIASQAEEIVVTPEGLAGSIGVWLMHMDLSRALEMEGVKVTWIHAGERKVDGNWSEPLSERAAAEMQAIVDNTYRLFVNDVAAGRKVPPATVKSAEWGEGAVLTAKDAKAIGMVDRIGAFTETLTRLAGGRSSSGARADDAPELPAAEALEEPEPPVLEQEPVAPPAVDAELELRTRRLRLRR